MPKLVIRPDFMRGFGDLDKYVRERVLAALQRFVAQEHPEVQLEKVTGAWDPKVRTLRINQIWHGVLAAPEHGDTYVLLKVLPRDEAVAYACGHQVSVNVTTGAIEVRDAASIEERAGGDRDAEQSRGGLFDHVGDDELRRLGVDAQVLRLARTLTDASQVEALQPLVPAGQYDALASVAGDAAAGDAAEEIEDDGSERPVEIDPEDLGAAAHRPASRAVLVTAPEELREIFARPFDQWRIFLHPSQHKLAHATYRGPARVSGGPGTGKTVVCLHRAYALTGQLDLPDRSILLTTFSRTHADALRRDLATLTAEDRDAAAKIEVLGADQLSNRLVTEQHGRDFRILDGQEQRNLFTHIAGQLGLRFSGTFLHQEWRDVVLAHGVTSEEGYLKASQRARRRQLAAHQGEQIWRAMEAFSEKLSRNRQRTYDTLCLDAARLLAEGGPRYRHVIVDEAQDLHPVHWQMLRVAVPAGPNDMFLASDTFQRIYDNHVSLKQVGVHVRGRSTRLRINYRTTAEVLEWSLGLVRGEKIDDMDGGEERLVGYRSDVHGTLPTAQGAAGKGEELANLVAKVRSWLDAGVEPHLIGVAARTNPLADEAASALTAAGIEANRVTGDHQALHPVHGGVQVATMHRMKGLEFRCTAVVGASDEYLPLSRQLTPADQDSTQHGWDMQRERLLLFVACTRAREELYVSWHGRPSPFLAGGGVSGRAHG